MKDSQALQIRKGKWPAIPCLLLLLALFGGCAGADLQKQVQDLTRENNDLRSQVQVLMQKKDIPREAVSPAQNTLRIDALDTASSVAVTNDQLDWRQYVRQDSFAYGYSGTFWVMFSFSNMLHNKTVNANADIYILTNGALKEVRNKVANLADTADNRLWWGDAFDISGYAEGDYTVILALTDLIAGTSAAQRTTFKIVK